MVETREALISSTATSGIVAISHGAAHYIVGGASELSDPAVMAAGTTVFATTWILSYTGMKGYLPF